MPNPAHRLQTAAIGAGRADLRRLGVTAPPIDLSATYPLGDLADAAADLDRWAQGDARGGNPIYARVHNPTVARFEAAIAELEGGEDAVAFGSGMAALTAVLLAVRQESREVVGVRPLYGTSDVLLASGLLGLDVVWAAAAHVADAVTGETGLVVLETPQNPTLELIDIDDVVTQAGPVPVLVDNTFATPVLQRPLAHGATFAWHSATKFIGGHGDAVGGVVVTDAGWAGRLRQIRFMTGALLHPFAAYLLHRGIPTLPLRIHAAQQSAIALADLFAAHHAVTRVHFPPFAAKGQLVGPQMDGPGSMIAIDLGSHERAAVFVQETGLALHAVSLGTFATLVEHPASLTHHLVDERAREESGISSGLVRLAIGLEDAEDLWNDFGAALSRVEAGGGNSGPSDAVTAG